MLYDTKRLIRKRQEMFKSASKGLPAVRESRPSITTVQTREFMSQIDEKPNQSSSSEDDERAEFQKAFNTRYKGEKEIVKTDFE